MDKLFQSERIFVDDCFINGGILVTPEGKIRKLFRSHQEIDLWKKDNKVEKVLYDFCIIFCLKII